MIPSPGDQQDLPRSRLAYRHSRGNGSLSSQSLITPSTSKEKAPLELKPVSPTAKGPAKTFTGDVYVTPIYRGPSRMIISLVRFTPGARSAWHSHAVGQTLHVTDGVGLVQTRDGKVIRMRLEIPSMLPRGDEHWHGATSAISCATSPCWRALPTGMEQLVRAGDRRRVQGEAANQAVGL